MRIAMVFDGLGYGGIERVGIDYCKLMINLGHEVDVYNLIPESNAMEGELPPKCQVIYYKFTNMMAPETYSYGVKKWWWGKYAYPVVFIVMSFALMIRKFINPIRHSKYDIAIAFSGHMNDLTFISCNFIFSLKKLCWLHGALYGYLLSSPGYLLLYQKIKNLVVLVDEAQEHVYQYNRFLNLNITKMYNPTFISERNINKSNVEMLHKKYGKFLLMVARFAYPHKDHYTIINGVKILKEKYGRDYKLLLVGDGEEMSRVKQFCVENLIQDNVVFVGSTLDVQDYYAASYILVHASVAGEGLPTVILEAMAFGKPVVVSDSKVGPREIIKNDEYGLLFGIRNSEEMAKKVESLYADENLYSYYSKQGYKRLEDFKPDVISKQLSSMFDKLV